LGGEMDYSRKGERKVNSVIIKKGKRGVRKGGVKKRAGEIFFG